MLTKFFEEKKALSTSSLSEEFEKKNLTNIDDFFLHAVSTGDSKKFQTIIELASQNKNFEKYCKSENLLDLWDDAWHFFGTLLFSKNETFLSQSDNANKFNLVCGAYFFYLSQVAKNTAEKDFSSDEIKYLKKGIEYASIHAIKRYNQYCYEQIKDTLISNEIDVLYEKIIENCEKVKKSYPTYTYLMLAEVYGSRASWYAENKMTTKAKKDLETAIQYCDFAEVRITEYEDEDDSRLENEQKHIHDASLGEGLGSSNSYNIADPRQLKFHIFDSTNSLIKPNTSDNNKANKFLWDNNNSHKSNKKPYPYDSNSEKKKYKFN